jgi:hypothetical protein
MYHFLKIKILFLEKIKYFLHILASTTGDRCRLHMLFPSVKVSAVFSKRNPNVVLPNS